MTTCLYGVAECVCANRRHPAAIPKNHHRASESGLRDFQYRAVFGGTLTKVMGTIAHSPIRIKR